MTTEETQQACAALLDARGVKMTAVFVPQSLSRNSAEKARTLNWRVTFVKDKQSFALDYQQGVGHIPAIVGKSYPQEMQEREWEASEKGRYQVRANSSYMTKTLPAPNVADILYCLVSDDTNGESLEDWASNFGYDIDSRKAEETYRACARQTRDARRVLGADVLDKARSLLEDY
jgi:hypothetical protein